MKDLTTHVQTNVTEEFVVTDNNHVTKVDDKYMDSIDLSNACREFYQTRKMATEAVKEKLSESGRTRTQTKKTSIDIAMETLRNEMASLMDQDLSLMKSLLTLNEAIEDLKWKNQYYHSHSSMDDSCSDSELSVSETDMFESESEAQDTTSSCCARAKSGHSFDFYDNDSCKKYSSKPAIPTSLNIDIPSESYKLSCHEELNSFDSGIHEAVIPKEITA